MRRKEVKLPIELKFDKLKLSINSIDRGKPTKSVEAPGAVSNQ